MKKRAGRKYEVVGRNNKCQTQKWPARRVKKWEGPGERSARGWHEG